MSVIKAQAGQEPSAPFYPKVINGILGRHVNVFGKAWKSTSVGTELGVRQIAKIDIY